MPKSILVAGAAGFIGSHLTDKLLSLGLHVIGLDNLSHGKLANLELAAKNPLFIFIKGDLLDIGLASRALGDCNLIFHLAADADVRAGAENPSQQVEQNLMATFNLLEAIRKPAVGGLSSVAMRPFV